MPLADTLAALLAADKASQRAVRQAAVRRFAGTAWETDDGVPGYVRELVSQLARGEPTEAPRDVPAYEVGWSWMLGDIPGLEGLVCRDEEHPHQILTIPHLRLRVVWSFPANDREQWSVQRYEPHVVEAREPFVGGWDPDEAAIRRWAYDTSLYLVPQGEDDLAVIQGKNVQLLLDLAADPACPRGADFVLWIDCWLQDWLLHSEGHDPRLLRDVRDIAQRSSADTVRALADRLERILAYAAAEGPVDRDGAERIACDLLVPVLPTPVLEALAPDGPLARGEVDGWWRFARFPDNVHYARTLYVAARTGALAFTRGAGVLSEADLHRLGDGGARTSRLLQHTLRPSEGSVSGPEAYPRS